MARSNNKAADDLLASAREAAVQDGLRLSVPQFFEAIDALISEGRSQDAQEILVEMLSAKEKVRGFFLGKREQSALGKERPTVANRYARVVFGSTPTEQSLDMLNQLSLEFKCASVRLTSWVDSINGAQNGRRVLGRPGSHAQRRDRLTAFRYMLTQLSEPRVN